MFCAQCGVKSAGGNFCTACGARLVQPEPGPASAGRVTQPDPYAALVQHSNPIPEGAQPYGDWSGECRYEVLMKYPEVRETIAQHAAKAPTGLTGEKFLDLCDAAFAPIPGVSLKSVAGIASAWYASMGVKTGQNRKGLLPAPIGRSIVSSLCSLAQHGRAVKEVQQADDGCVVHAAIPSDIWSFEGELVITLTRAPRGTRIEAGTNIPGQWYDWGKSKKCLAQLFQDVESIAA